MNDIHAGVYEFQPDLRAGCCTWVYRSGGIVLWCGSRALPGGNVQLCADHYIERVHAEDDALSAAALLIQNRIAAVAAVKQ